MDIFIWRWVTVVLTVCTITSTLPSNYANPLSAGKTSTSKVNQTKSDCLFNQYYDIINQVCENCTLCPPGTQHSSQEVCGFGEGVNTTCDPCEEKKYQPHEGYSHLKCTSCVTCDPNADILQNCNATQNAQCGPCHAGYYEFSPNWCVECTHNPGHEDCKQTTTPTNQHESSTNNVPSTPATTQTTSLKTDDHPSSSIPPNKGTTDAQTKVTGSQTIKGSALTFWLLAVIVVIVICVVIYAGIQWRKRTGTCSSSSDTSQNASYKPVSTISKDQPSTSSAADAEIACESARRISRQSSRETDREQLLGAGITETQPSYPSSAVTNEYSSGPLPLSSNGGEIRNGLGIMYPHLDQGQLDNGAQMSTEGEPGSPGSPDSAKVNFNFQNDDGQNDSTTESVGLRS